MWVFEYCCTGNTSRTGWEERGAPVCFMINVVSGALVPATPSLAKHNCHTQLPHTETHRHTHTTAAARPGYYNSGKEQRGTGEVAAISCGKLVVAHAAMHIRQSLTSISCVRVVYPGRLEKVGYALLSRQHLASVRAVCLAHRLLFLCCVLCLEA